MSTAAKRISRRLTPRRNVASQPMRGRRALLITAVAACGLAYFAFRSNRRHPGPPRTLIAVDLSSQPPDTSVPSIFNLRPAPSHYDTIRVLRYAARDPSIKGVICNLTPRGPWTLAAAQEIRDVIHLLKANNKLTVAYSETFGEGGDGNTSYYLASAFDRIMLAPSGDVNIVGLFLQQPFVKNLLDKLAIKPQFIKRKEYKNAPNMFTESGFTDAHKDQLTSIGTSMYNQMCQGIADGRNMSVDHVKDILANGPYTADEAMELGLIDEFIYEGEIIDHFKWDRVKLGDTDSTRHEKPLSDGKNATADHVLQDLPFRNKIVRFPMYATKALLALNASKWFTPSASKIALIYGVGAVTTQPPGPFASGPNFHSGTLAKVIRNASKDPTIKSIVFRIDSPGGSYIAADTVYAALMDAKAQGKKIVVSMGSVAASGGYFAAAPADFIYADPGTITGSIGVFGGKFALRKFLEEKIGVTFDEIRWGGETSGMYRDVGEWNGAQLKKLDSAMDRVYADFVGKVSLGRGLTLAQTESVARGRVWTGEEAIDNGLVDGLGGLYDAIEKAREFLPEAQRQSAKVVTLPRRTGIQKTVMKAIGGGDPEFDEEPLFQQAEGGDASSIMNNMRDGMNFIYELTGLRDSSIAQALWRSMKLVTSTETSINIEDNLPELINQNNGKGQF